MAEDGRLLVDLPVVKYPEWALHSINLKRPLLAEDFRLVSTKNSTVTANVIGVIENQAPTRHLQMPVHVEGGEVRANMAHDLAKVALVERHHATGKVNVALVHGFGFCKPCAVATTMAHDSHQMIVVGTDDQNMAVAANYLAETGGGQVVVLEEQIIGQVNLPIAGLISNEHAETVAQKASSVLDGFRACGCTLNNPNMQLSLLGLVVIPDLRISDKGLIDVNHFRVLPVLE